MHGLACLLSHLAPTSDIPNTLWLLLCAIRKLCQRTELLMDNFTGLSLIFSIFVVIMNCLLSFKSLLSPMVNLRYILRWHWLNLTITFDRSFDGSYRTFMHLFQHLIGWLDQHLLLRWVQSLFNIIRGQIALSYVVHRPCIPLSHLEELFMQLFLGVHNKVSLELAALSCLPSLSSIDVLIGIARMGVVPNSLIVVVECNGLLTWLLTFYACWHSWKGLIIDDGLFTFGSTLLHVLFQFYQLIVVVVSLSLDLLNLFEHRLRNFLVSAVLIAWLLESPTCTFLFNAFLNLNFPRNLFRNLMSNLLRLIWCRK